MLYISLDFSFFPLIFPPFLGIDHLENVSMRYRYPKVLGYRVLGIGIDPALLSTGFSLAHFQASILRKLLHYVVSELLCSISSFAGFERRGVQVVSLHFAWFYFCILTAGFKVYRIQLSIVLCGDRFLSVVSHHNYD